MQRIKIVGGISTIGRVSILSDEFVATARSKENNKITCTVERHSAFIRFIYKNNNLPIPRLVRLALLLVDSITGSVWKFIAGACVLSLMLSGIFSQPVPKSSSSFLAEAFFWSVYIIFWIGILVCIRQSIATWHGAEHMVIAAYEHTGSTDIQMIARECPVNEKCGGRLILPLMIGTIIANIIARNFEMNETIISLVIMECLLWVDKLKGFEKIPVTSQASYFLQKWFTTRYPGNQELRTAQTALKELISAHKTL